AVVVFAGVMLAIRGFRGGKHRPPPRVLPPPPDDEPEGRSQPRQQHYQYAHVILRDLVLTDPEAAFDRVTLPGSGDLLIDLWTAAHGLNPREERISPEGIRVHVEGDIAFISLPPPARGAEAYMVAVTRRGAYYTLEKGDGGPAVAQWTQPSRATE